MSAAPVDRVLRAGVVGLGMMGRNHARVLSGLPGVQLVGVVDPGSAHAPPPGVPVLPDLAALLESGVDHVVLSVPTAQHEELALALAAAGVHALVEKPLSSTSAAARRITAAFADAGLVGGVGHIERFNPALRSLRERLRAGELGQVFQVTTRREGPFPARIADVGVVLDLATHDIDLTAWVGGGAYTSVSARTAHRSGRTNEDLVAIVGTLDTGVIVQHSVSWVSPVKRRSVTVTGELGAFTADLLTADLTFYANGTGPQPWSSIAEFRGVSEGDVTRYAIPKPEPLITEHEAFRDAVLGRASGTVTMTEATRVVRTAEAVLESARTGQTVDLPA